MINIYSGTPKTPLGMSSGQGGTPINLQKLDSATIQRAAAGLPSNIYNALQQVAGHTPYTGGPPPGPFGQFQVRTIFFTRTFWTISDKDIYDYHPTHLLNSFHFLVKDIIILRTF